MKALLLSSQPVTTSRSPSPSTSATFTPSAPLPPPHESTFSEPSIEHSSHPFTAGVQLENCARAPEASISDTVSVSTIDRERSERCVVMGTPPVAGSTWYARPAHGCWVFVGALGERPPMNG